MVKVMCFGTFDNLHLGHLFYLKEARKLGDYLVVVVARDENVEKTKKKKPRDSESVRLSKLKKSNIADKVILGNRGDKMLVLKDERPDIIALGYDQEADIDKIRETWEGEIIRLKAYKPEIYKSSKMK